MRKYYALLKSSPLFSGINETDLPDILSELEAYTKNFEKDEYIKRSGDSADFIGIVLEGSIQIVQDDFYGNRSITASFGKGAIFAEAFACANIPSLSVDILSSSKTVVLFISKINIFQTCSRDCKYHHTIIGNLLSIVAKKNMILNQKLQYMSQRTTSEKIMTYLSDQARIHGSNEFTIPFNRQELADYLGVERSAMSAEISKLVKNKVIETNRSCFKLLKG